LTASLIVGLTSGCFHWSHVEDLDDVIGAERVRVEPPGEASYVLPNPSVEQVRDVVAADHARISVRKLDGWATGSLIGVAVIATAVPILALILVAALSHTVNEAQLLPP
jgi:hypothetical protein